MTSGDEGAGRRVPWIAIAVVAVGALVHAVPGLDAVAAYDRARIADGQAWRLLTGSLAHWSTRMAAWDLGVLLIVAGWLEHRSRRSAVAVWFAAPLAIAAVLWWATPDVTSYRGASGLASAFYVALALDLLRSASRNVRWVALAALALLVAKIVREATGGGPIAAGSFPEGVAVLWQVHLAGALAGGVKSTFHRVLK